jgi:hypothetical protein
MLWSIRSAAGVSTISVLLGLAGCVDPAARFDEFAARIPDAPAMAVCVDAPQLTSIPDISGEFLYSILTALSSTPLQSIATVVVTSPNPPTATISVRFLATADRTLTGAATMPYNVTVDSVGAFTVTIPQLLVPAAANIFMADLSVTNIVLNGNIRSADLFCGTLASGTTLGQNLAGSTFGAIRVQAGQQGTALPDPVTSCPADCPGM